MKNSNQNFHHHSLSGKNIPLPPSLKTTKSLTKINNNDEKSLIKKSIQQYRSSSLSSLFRKKRKSKWQKMSTKSLSATKKFSKDISVKMPESFSNKINPKIEQQQQRQTMIMNDPVHTNTVSSSTTTTTTTLLKNTIPMIKEQSRLKLIHPIIDNNNNNNNSNNDNDDANEQSSSSSLLFQSNKSGSVFTFQDKLPNDSALQLLSIMTNNRSMNNNNNNNSYKQSTMILKMNTSTTAIGVGKEKTEIFVAGKGHLKSQLYNSDHDLWPDCD
ncbi:uncharacterized protein LOC113789854 isoform X2 [Dermatophagoides pteronyssinus]|uniref:uncharacterized protein LOC113789854 isoform X2 n=1 Tax=Dermatophagoides pteronyssinus TaxID=6956 RepID=UPI003F6690F1